MANLINALQNMVTLEDQLRAKVLEVIQKFLLENADQKITLWNGMSLTAVMKSEMNKVMTVYDEEQKRIKQEKENTDGSGVVDGKSSCDSVNTSNVDIRKQKNR